MRKIGIKWYGQVDVKWKGEARPDWDWFFERMERGKGPGPRWEVDEPCGLMLMDLKPELVSEKLKTAIGLKNKVLMGEKVIDWN